MLFSGSSSECKSFLRSREDHYVYVLRGPDGRPFYVGKGYADRVFSHENEARHPNDHRSNAYKLNVIRSIWRESQSVTYEIDLVASDEAVAYRREAELIQTIKRLHEGGPLTNLAPGGGTSGGVAPISKEKHTATLSGLPDNNPERATLNKFVLGIGKMDSVVIKPIGRFTARPTQRYPSKSMGITKRQAVALVASAAANGISVDGACSIPRRLTVEGVSGLVENGVANDILSSGLANVIRADNPADESFVLSSDQARKVVGQIGMRKCVDLGILPSTVLRVGDK